MNLGKTVTYTGEILDCVKQGKGTYKYPGGLYTYEGPWVNGKKHGSGGKFTFIGGATYEGDFTDGEITGKGTKIWADGRKYTGDFAAGEMTGKGIWKNSNGKEIYEGDFLENRRHGQGYNRLPNGDIYNGEFSFHRFHGRGSYLRENSFIVTSNFDNGFAHGTGVINWNKIGSYEGDISNGCIHGTGEFSTFDGSYRYCGEFIHNNPDYYVNKLHLYVDKSCIKDSVDADTKGKKKASKPKKGDPAADVLTTVSAGQEIGKIIFLMSTDKSEEFGENAGEWKVPLFIPNPAEVHRSMILRLREYFPPSPPGKGEPIPEPNPDVELGAVIPLWQRKSTQKTRSGAWDRFPISNCVRYIDGVNILTGEEVVVEGETSPFADDGNGMVSAKVAQSNESSVSISFIPSSLPNATERLIVIADFRFQLNMTTTTFANCTVNNKSFDIIPIMSLCNRYGGLEGKSRLELVFLKPTNSEMKPEGAENKNIEEAHDDECFIWTNCLWELQLCEEVEQSPLEVPGDERDEEIVEENADNEPRQLCSVTKRTTICRWADSACFNHSTWHSIALTLQQCSGVDNVELTVDGTGRMKIDGAFEEGIAAGWLPASVTDANATDENESEMVFRVGRGECFGGWVKSLVLVSGKYGSAQDMTSAFDVKSSNGEVLSDQVSESVDTDNDMTEDGQSLSSVPSDCNIVEQINLATCGGRGSIDGILIPSNTPHATYVLEVADGVDSRCISSNATAGGPESTKLHPGDMAPLCQMVPGAGSSFMTFKISVTD